jgi:hypothetical protein
MNFPSHAAIFPRTVTTCGLPAISILEGILIDIHRMSFRRDPSSVLASVGTEMSEMLASERRQFDTN